MAVVAAVVRSIHRCRLTRGCRCAICICNCLEWTCVMYCAVCSVRLSSRTTAAPAVSKAPSVTRRAARDSTCHETATRTTPSNAVNETRAWGWADRHERSRLGPHCIYTPTAVCASAANEASSACASASDLLGSSPSRSQPTGGPTRAARLVPVMLVAQNGSSRRSVAPHPRRRRAEPAAVLATSYAPPLSSTREKRRAPRSARLGRQLRVRHR